MQGQKILQEISSLMIGLGLMLSLAVVVSAFTTAQHEAALVAASPFDQVDAVSGADTGFVPLIVPDTAFSEPVIAPTIPPEILVVKGVTQNASRPEGTAPNPMIGDGPVATATPLPLWLPDRLVIPAIQLDAPVLLATLKNIDYLGTVYQQWVAPNTFAAGRLIASAPLGVPGNTVFIGHGSYNGLPKVFAHLADLEVGDLIQVYSGDKAFAYAIVLKMILPERFQPVAVRLTNAQWIEPSLDERLTLVTCWPYGSNTHRLIIVAVPLSPEALALHSMIPRSTPLAPLIWNPVLPVAATLVAPAPTVP